MREIEWLESAPSNLGEVSEESQVRRVEWLGAPSSRLGAIVWMADEGDPSVKTYQAWINRMLDRCGYWGIEVDGRVGKNTCGAGAMLGDLKNKSCYVNALPSDPVPDTGVMASVMSVCQSFTFPTKKGDTQPDKPTTTLTPEELALPWGVADDRTTKVQQDLNNDLDGHDYFPITVTSILDAPTCGAMRTAENEWGMNYLQVFGLNCQAFTDPEKKPVEAQPPPTPCAPGERRNVATGQCETIECAEGEQLDTATNQCVPVPPTPTAGRRKKKSNMGLLLLGAAALAAGAFALA